ncbi:general secretion pathway protein M [bacterium BMS3Bbin05]|nr:general secretion pathway protein M [bacterium BMS3Bbin05]HDO21497.1 hypothetical protein [Nitrospirota bacterium]
MRKPLIALLFILAAILLYSVVFTPLNEWHDGVVERLKVKSETLGRYRSFLSSASETEEKIKTVNAELKKNDISLIDSANDAIAVAKLNSYLQDVLERSGMEVISIKPYNVVKYKLFAGFPIQITATADIKQVRDFLQEISEGKYLVSVDTINIRVINFRKPDKLRVRVLVSGYRKI